jgi:hypothetical protein
MAFCNRGHVAHKQTFMALRDIEWANVLAFWFYSADSASLGFDNSRIGAARFLQIAIPSWNSGNFRKFAASALPANSCLALGLRPALASGESQPSKTKCRFTISQFAPGLWEGLMNKQTNLPTQKFEAPNFILMCIQQHEQ